MTHEISAGLGKEDGERGEFREKEWMRRPWRVKERGRERERRGGGGRDIASTSSDLHLHVIMTN